MDPVNPHCQQLASPGYFNFTLSLTILVGILVSYLPQHIRIISLRSSFGISPYFVLLGTTSATSAFANILVLPRSAQDAACCREISGLACFAGLLGIFQVGVQCLCFYVILLLFLIYYPRAISPTSPTVPVSSTTKPTDAVPPYRTAVTVAILCVVHAVILLIMSILIAITQPSHLQAWANILGIMSAILASIQYFPQIYTTFRLRRVGSLSIQTMCIQTPGSLLWAASLAERLGTEGWSTWGVYVVTALLQGTLLAMGIYFEYLGPKKDILPQPRYEDAVQQPQQPSEQTPLLQS
ncbi:hypothetical protein VTN77DRAFT_1119 [Rasamsonia byssochlamydoides]|uniref:uncharacterized protein n=1 Tax=Rasamsonia byssochlamydoides TaxID=89139 RepID=UPI00374214CF